jgi:predicted Zn-dependent protease
LDVIEELEDDEDDFLVLAAEDEGDEKDEAEEKFNQAVDTIAGKVSQYNTDSYRTTLGNSCSKNAHALLLNGDYLSNLV